MSLQRHLKVLGIFVRLFERDGKDRYLANLPKVFNDLLHALAAVNAKGENAKGESDNVAAFTQWLTTVVKPAFDQKIQG